MQRAPSADGVPDTLLLEDRARIALNTLTRYVDENDDYRPYMTADLVSEPASLAHSGWDYGSSVGRLVSSITLAREMTGDTRGEDVERRLRERLLDMFAEDGLNYRSDTEHGEPRANMHDQRSVLLGLVTWYMATEDPEVEAAADGLCAALRRIAVKSGHPHLAKQDFWYFPAVEYTPDGWPSRDAIYLGMAVDPAHTSARMINPLAKYYELTGNEDAFELAKHFSRHTVEYSGAFNDDGSFNDGTEFRTGHFHSRMVSVTAIARFAMQTGNAAYLNWARTVYDWALSQGTRFGWFPSALREDYVHKHETCALVDMVELGIMLANGGYPEYWETVERFVRNHLTETQLLGTDWVDDEGSEADEDARRDVGDRSQGAFPGWAAPNDFVCDVGSDPDVMTCCIASGTRGLFLAWRNVVTEERDVVSVNFLLNRGTSRADVFSYLPHEGRVEVVANRDARRLRVRVPSWVDPTTLDVTRSGGPDADVRWDGPFVGLEDVSEGERVVLSFPMAERETTERAADREYRVEWRGDDVTSITPQGSHYPLYADREIHDEVPIRDVEYRRGDGLRW